MIDWSDLLLGPGELDLGIVKAGLETLPLAIPGLARPLLSVQRWLVRRFLAAYSALRPIDPEALGYGEVWRCARTWLAIARFRLDPAAPRPVPYDRPLGGVRVAARLRELTGLRPELPPQVAEP